MSLTAHTRACVCVFVSVWLRSTGVIKGSKTFPAVFHLPGAPQSRMVRVGTVGQSLQVTAVQGAQKIIFKQALDVPFILCWAAEDGKKNFSV